MRETVSIDPDGDIASLEHVACTWVRYRLTVAGEAADVPVTVPVPAHFTAPLETVLAAIDAGPLIGERLAILHGETRYADRAWTIAGRDVITAAEARALFPDDPFTGAGYCIHA